RADPTCVSARDAATDRRRLEEDDVMIPAVQLPRARKTDHAAADDDDAHGTDLAEAERFCRDHDARLVLVGRPAARSEAADELAVDQQRDAAGVDDDPRGRRVPDPI